MSEMIERVAQAIFDYEYRDPRRARPEPHPPWSMYRGHARAAIEAMREPTAAMCHAVDHVMPGDTQGEAMDNAADVWRGMIDVALGGC